MTSTITVVAHITADPSSVAEVHSALLIAVEATQSEHGCLHYRLFENMDTQGHWTMLELWQNDDALTQHTLGEAFKNLSAAIDGKASVPGFSLGSSCFCCTGGDCCKPKLLAWKRFAMSSKLT